MPKNLEISGTNRRRLEAGERLLGLLSGDLHVEGVGAEIEPLAPDQFSGSTDLHLAKLADISPQGKDAFASHGGDIGHAGHAIGKFQALQHRMATLALEIEQARSAAINAADRFPGDRVERERAASAAKATIGKAGSLVAEEAIQMHGALGVSQHTPLARMYANTRTLRIADGPDEVHHMVVGRNELQQYREMPNDPSMAAVFRN